MEVKAYNGEHFTRTIWWYIIFGVLLVGVIILSIRYMNFFGAIILFLVAGGYIFFGLTKNKRVTIAARESGFVVDARLRAWSSLENFVVEVHKDTQEYYNLIVVSKKQEIMVFSFDDEQSNKEVFVQEMQKYLPLVESAPFSNIEKFARRVKL